MKGAKNTHYLQIDNKIEKICQPQGTEILPAELAWKKYDWVKKYFTSKPKNGYFIWVKEQLDHPLLTCVSITVKKIKQEMQNLLVVEKGLKINIQGSCGSAKKQLNGSHKAKGKIILKQGATVDYQHIHSWGEKDAVETDYDFQLEKNSRLDYKYRVVSPPRELKVNTRLTLWENAAADLEATAVCVETKIKLKDTLILKGKNASGMVKLRLVGGRNSHISADSQIRAEAEAKGHLDCQGLLIDDKAKVSMTPALVCSHKKAQITHEASIGRVSETELNYLMTRGLTEKQAMDMIINGFLAYD